MNVYQLNALKYAMAGDDLVARYKRLSPRELEVAEFIASGYRSKEMAYFMKISHRTVEVHRASVIEKLGLRDSYQIPLAMFQLEVRKRAQGGSL